MGEGTLDVRRMDRQVADALFAHLLNVMLQRHRSWPGVVVHGHQFRRSRPALRGDCDLRDIPGHSLYFAELLGTHAAKQFVHHGEAESGALSQLPQGQRAGHVEDLQHQILEDGLAYSKFGDAVGGVQGTAPKLSFDRRILRSRGLRSNRSRGVHGATP